MYCRIQKDRRYQSLRYYFFPGSISFFCTSIDAPKCHLDLDSELFQILIMLHILRNRVTDNLCTLLAVLLCPLSKELLVAFRCFLLLVSSQPLHSYRLH